jgi:hypothetical protein
MTRAEHLQWAKDRALAYLPDSPREAVTSMLSDLGKHDETKRVLDGPIGMIGIMEAAQGSVGSVRRFIEGFN